MLTVEQPLFVCVSTSYDVQRLYEESQVEDFEENFPEDMTTGKLLYRVATKALKNYKSLLCFMGIARDEADNHILNSIEEIGDANDIGVNRWSPIFQCNTMMEALTMLPNIVKVCRDLSWCNIWKDQDFNDMRTFPLTDGHINLGTIVFLELEAESG